MTQTITLDSFRQAFKAYDREEQFSHEGLEALFNYLENLENETDTIIELDVISLCCEYTEYETLKDFQDNYGQDYETLEDIEYRKQVIIINKDSFIIQSF